MKVNVGVNSVVMKEYELVSELPYGIKLKDEKGTTVLIPWHGLYRVEYIQEGSASEKNINGVDSAD